MQEAHESPTNKVAIIGIVLALLIYAGLAMVLGPEGLSISHGDDHSAEHGDHGSGESGDSHDQHDGEADHDSHAADSHDADAHDAKQAIPAYWAVTPFVLLLGGIAILPLISATAHWWESNANRFLLSVSLALLTMLYYLVAYPGGGLPKVLDVLKHAVLGEYVPFIVLLFSLYTITGGIRIIGDLVAKPTTNVGFLVVGGLLASFVGTTGAAMLLIRSLIETNNERKYITHTVVFFIFVVCNCGGCLLPIGDPPLFLGYLCLLYTSPSPRDATLSRMPSSA